MNCEQVKSFLYDRALEGAANPGAPNQDLDAHLATCQACQTELADLELTHKLMRQGLPEEEPARRIVFTAEASRYTANPLRFWQWSFAGAATFAMLFAVLAFRRPAVVAAPSPAATPVAATFTRTDVEKIVNQAVAASEERQKMEMANVIHSAAERMSDQLHYLQSSQTQVYKQTEQNRADLRQVTALMGVRQ
jgi:predicted anti-sigma-YlaC factor YlaD